MDEFSKVLALSEDETVELGASFKELLNTRLVLGNTRWMCRYGTLSEGHGKLTPSQRYYQAIREMYYTANNIKNQRIEAKKAQADILEAQCKLESATKPYEKLRAEAELESGQLKLMNALVQSEDAMRVLDEYNKVRLELEPEVSAQYPLGIEQAEEDNWTATYKWEKLRGNDKESWRIPLPPIDKAKLGIEFKCVESLAPLIIANEAQWESIPNEDPDKLQKFVDSVSQPKQLEDNS